MLILVVLTVLLVAAAGEQASPPDLAALPHLDQDGHIPSGHLRSVGGTLVLPAECTAIDLVRNGWRVGNRVILPAIDHPLLRTTRTAIAAIADAWAMANGLGPERIGAYLVLRVTAGGGAE